MQGFSVPHRSFPSNPQEIAMKLKGLVCALAAALCTVSTAGAQSLPAGPKITVTAVTQAAPTIPQYTRVDVPMLRENMPKASNGRIEFNLKSWPEANVQGPEVIRLVRSGQVDIGGVPLTTVSGDVPILDGVDLAGLNPEIETAYKVATAMVPVANRELERLGVRIIATYPYPAQVFFCRKPIAGLADFKGLKIRVNGPSPGDLMNALGAQPTALAFGEVYSALERGTVDCGVTGTGSGNGVKWYEVTSHLYNLPISWSTAAYIVNLAWWNKLDPAVRSFLEAQLKQVQEAQWKLGADATQDGVDCNIGNAAGCKIGNVVKNKPMTLVKASDADKARIREALTTVVLPNWVKRCGAKCGETYNEVIAPITGVRYRP
jgi:TRAP-type C4-dicarboxylate transport system substrate-binding protein